MSAYIRQIIISISSIHKLNRFNDPTRDCDVQPAIRKMHRKFGRSSKQVAGITRKILKKLVFDTENDLRGIRDIALLLIAYDTLCRRSELVELLTEDIKKESTEKAEGVRLSKKSRKSKTDQNSLSRWLHLTDQASKALEEWLVASGIQLGPIFRGINRGNEISEKLESSQIARIYKRMAKAVNLNCDTIKNISGHSIRAGAAQDLLREGANLPVIMNRGRWSKTDTVMRYWSK